MTPATIMIVAVAGTFRSDSLAYIDSKHSFIEMLSVTVERHIGKNVHRVTFVDLLTFDGCNHRTPIGSH